uniref:uncharacterized protein LOC122585262 isoform X2 n=1 Tax=Erigeron canadensis TaxID=72917 RepID=UPI001CB9808C|nr:uncharacterized protein LOC122585262 isoform X2 [Erigeron canadensis]
MSSPIWTIAQTSNWLRRLHASKGFPDTDDTDLEGFLSGLYKHVDRDLAPTVTRNDLDKSADSAMRGFNDVFSELTENTKRNLRNSDKISWSFPLKWTVKRRRTVKKVNQDLKIALFPLARTLKRKRTVREVNRERKSGEHVKVEEKGDLDLSGSLKTEVTIIDTSNRSWISEKTLYRRKNVWEVGDKKGKSLMSGDNIITNKSLIHNGDGDVWKKFQPCSSLKSWAAAERGDIKKKRGQLRNSSVSTGKALQCSEGT